jgi:hypothetical protein
MLIGRVVRVVKADVRLLHGKPTVGATGAAGHRRLLNDIRTHAKPSSLSLKLSQVQIGPFEDLLPAAHGGALSIGRAVQRVEAMPGVLVMH